jgi:hypothetical protein
LGLKDGLALFPLIRIVGLIDFYSWAGIGYCINLGTEFLDGDYCIGLDIF